ncbi:MAG: hypothetical protein IGS48_23560 [Oscillatoriales cyanobacterium C42_A2020_001]|nr:hypothetical protein [Leptolyngbyaceae cyanobacterium C42_A2020_001]
MSDSISTKPVIVINAIAITIALAIISGYLPLNLTPLAHLNSLLQKGLVHR